MFRLIAMLRARVLPRVLPSTAACYPAHRRTALLSPKYTCPCCQRNTSSNVRKAMGLVKGCLRSRLQGERSGRLEWLQGGGGCGFLIAAMRNVQVLVAPQQPIKLSQASPSRKLALIIAIVGTKVSSPCLGGEGQGCHQAFWHCSSSRCTCCRYNDKDGIFHTLVGFSRRLAAPLAIRNVLST